VTTRHVLDPIAAYDRIAPVYARLADERGAYLDAIDRLIVAHIPPEAGSMLDIGCGDGARSARIAGAGRIGTLTLLEPSAAMRSRCPALATVWPMRAEDLPGQDGEFDIVTCLWNVLGHILPAAARVDALRQFARLVSPCGRVFVDVNHRYNTRHYGALATSARFLRDRFSPDGANGDVTVTWNVHGGPVSTTGHVFTHREFAALARDAGLRIEKRFVVDYATGELRRRNFEGHLLYILRRD
jgi:SAM-dependent methyltransferase